MNGEGLKSQIVPALLPMVDSHEQTLVMRADSDEGGTAGTVGLLLAVILVLSACAFSLF